MKIITGLVLYLCVLLSAPLASAQTETQKAEFRAALSEFLQDAQPGTRSIDLANEATLSLPADERFVPAAATARLLRATGAPVDDKQLLGAVIPLQNDGNWAAILSFAKDGYIRDDDALHWNADSLLQTLSKNTEAANPARRDHGFPELTVLGWAQAPAYDAGTHRLSWSAIVQPKNAPGDSAHQSINYQTIALGRDGRLSVLMVTPLGAFAGNKAIADGVIANIAYDSGKRYTDFNKFTDHVAEYGLAALIVGLAAKKLGLLAVLTALLLKFSKIGVLIAAAYAGVRQRLKKKQAAAPSPTDRQEPQ